MPKTKSSVGAPGGIGNPPAFPFKPSIPPAEAGIQYNFCKNPECGQYGVVPTLPHRRGKKGPYAFVSAAKHYPLLKCNACGEMPPLKSNRSIVQELNRLSAYLRPNPPLTCPNQACGNHGIPLGTPKAYRSFGKSKSGAARHQCAKCRKTFSLPTPTQYQHETHHNQLIFKMVVNKVALSRIVAMLGISWAVLYNRIDFIHRQCLAFVADRERRLEDLPIRRLYLAVDKQEHLVNWTERHDKRNVSLSAIASADNTSGYVFGVHPNFDALIDREAIESDAATIGDSSLPAPHRKYAHLWLEADYLAAANRKKPIRPLGDSSLEQEIAATYVAAAQRDDVEAFDDKTNEEKLPDYGVQVRAEYTMIAHFYFLKRMLGKVEKWRFFLDQESGIRAAFLSAFEREIKLCTADAFYVQIEKELTVDEKRTKVQDAKREFKQFHAQVPHLSEEQARLELLKMRIAHMREIGPWKDRWVKHPDPTMSEAEKSMCWLTTHYEFDDDHTARLYNKASLHSVDVFFQKVRRRIYLLERPVSSSGNAGRTWNGYAAYNPSMVVKFLEIFRVVHNYVDTRKTKGVATTPAMRLGLAKAPLTYGDIIYFTGH
jgi:transposase-like protein